MVLLKLAKMFLLLLVLLLVLVLVTCSKVKGRGLPPCCVPGIHILSGDQAPHSGYVSVLAALEEIPERISRRERDCFLGSQGPPGGC